MADPNPEKLLADFEAWFPQIKSAILFGGDGAQLKMELAESDKDAALALARDGQHQILRVQIYKTE